MWATNQLKELIIKGFVLDNKKLKNPDNPFGKDYFDELLERVWEIRASELDNLVHTDPSFGWFWFHAAGAKRKRKARSA
ncbi:virulence RhuM family protein [Litoribacter ruber]|nr:virulence RhuM family protein [Litoribacter ruber]